jgi:hypothetical protein
MTLNRHISGVNYATAQYFVLSSRLTGRRCYLVRHPRGILLQKRNVVQCAIEKRVVIQIASANLLISGVRFIEPVQSSAIC